MDHEPKAETSANTNHHLVTVLALCMIIGIITRHVIKRNHLHIPANMFAIVCAISAGVTIANVEVLRIKWFTIKMSPQHAITAYAPVFIMSTIYNMDHLLFRRYFIQAALVTLSSALITPVLLSVFLTIVVYKDWDYNHALLFSLISLPLEPRYIVDLFQVLSNYKFLATMLQLESVMVIICFQLGNLLVSEYDMGTMSHWYQFLIQIGRQLLGGAIIGYLTGIILMRLILYMYHEPERAVCISVIMAYLTGSLCEYVIWVSPSMGLLCMSAYLITNKHKLNVETDKCLQIFWTTFYHVVETPMLMLAMAEVTLYAVLLFQYSTMYGAVFLYFVGCLERLRACLMLVPVLNRMTYNINARCLFILGCSGVRGTWNLYPLLLYLGWQHLSGSMRSFLLSAMCYVVLSNFINCIAMRRLLKVMGLLNITSVRWANMYHCMTYLRGLQICLLDALKENRYLSNANWSLIRAESFVFEAYLQRASEVRKAVLYNEQHHDQWKDHVLICPDCHKEFRDEYTPKEVEDLLNKSHLKILKSQKATVIKQFESGYIDKKVLQILVHHLDTTIESQSKRRKEIKLNLNQASPNMKVLTTIIKFLNAVSLHGPPISPTNRCRRLCHYIVNHQNYDILMFAITIANALFVLWNDKFCCGQWMYFYHVTIWIIYCLEYILRTISFVNYYLSYWKRILAMRWYIIDLVFLGTGLCDAVITDGDNVFDWVIYHVPSYRLLAALRLVTGIRLLENHARKITAHINYTIDTYLALRFQLSSAWFDSIDTILTSLPHIIAEAVAFDYYQNYLKEEHAHLLAEMADVQKTRPWIAVSVRTWQAIRMSLYNMDLALKDMTRVGEADAIESAVVTKVLRERQQQLRAMRFITPNTINVYFEEVPWMPQENEEVMNYLYTNAVAMARDAHDIIMKESELAAGVYVVVTGELILSYKPVIHHLEDDVEDEEKEYDGRLPIVDFLASTNYKLPIEEVITSVSTVGELSVVSRRPYDCTIYGGSPSQGYWLPVDVLRTAMRMCNNPVTGLEARMWRTNCENLAVAMLMEAPEYHTATKAEIAARLQSAFMPVLRSFETFVVTVEIEGLLLINGKIVNVETEEVYIAPMLIPSSAWILHLVQNTEENVEVNMMILPREDCTPLQVMKREEEVADFLPDVYNKELLVTKVKRKMTKWQMARKQEDNTRESISDEVNSF